MRRVLILNILLLAIIGGLIFQIVTLWWFHQPEAEATAPKEAKTQKVDVPKVDRRPAPRILRRKLPIKTCSTSPGPGSPQAPPSQPLRPSRFGR